VTNLLQLLLCQGNVMILLLLLWLLLEVVDQSGLILDHIHCFQLKQNNIDE